MTSAFKTSINVKAIGTDPKKVAANLEHDGDRALYSTIFGVAVGLSSQRADPRDPSKMYQGLGGTFEVCSPDGLSVSSKILYAPEVIHNTIVAQLNQAERAAIEFAFESYVVKGGTAGFSWEYRFLSEPNSEKPFDPLAALKSRLMPKAVEGSKEVPALDAPHSSGKKSKAA
jgi:hypothetical protein